MGPEGTVRPPAPGNRQNTLALEDGRATPASSTVGNERVFKAPATAEALEHAMARPYDGNRETAKKFSRRIYRIADVLQEMGAEVDMQEVELKVARANFSARFTGKRLKNSSPLSKTFSVSFCWKIHLKSKKKSMKPV